MTQEELNNIIKLHQNWINGEEDGARADLSDADLSDANLSVIYLNDANLYNTNLRNSNLRKADLSYTYLSYANLSDANLSYANLSDANLSYANLSDANLSDANLSGANLTNTNLTNTTLNWVNWHEAYGLKVYVAGLQSSRENAQLVYIPSLDIATTGCWQDTWEATKKRVASVYDEDDPIYKKYQLAFNYIEAQMKLDNL